MSSPLLTASELAVAYADRRQRRFGRPVPLNYVVQGVSLSLDAGRAVGLVGESGSGKSSVARALLGLEPLRQGTLRYRGQEWQHLKRSERFALKRKIQLVFQDPSSTLDPRLSVARSVAEPLAIHGLHRGRQRLARVRALLSQVGLAEEHMARHPHELSGGQRQRVVLARALALEPEILVCDEPLSSLDVSIQGQILELLREWKQRLNLSILLISHDLTAVRALCEEVLVLYRGRVVEQAPSERLFGAPRHPYTRALLASVPRPDPRLRAERAAAPETAAASEEESSKVGCPYRPRCALYAIQRARLCTEELPVLRAFGPGEYTACHLVEA